MAEIPEVAVSRAFSTLVEGVYNANGYDLRYRGVESVDVIPVDHLTTIGAALRAAEAMMKQQMNKLVARVMHRLNLESRVNTMPVDVLIMIFQAFEPAYPGTANRQLNLLLVCRTWHDIIVASPQLWEDLDPRMPLDVARLVIKRSRSHPISLYWPFCGISDGPEREKSNRFLDLAIENSIRIRRADIYASPSSYLDVPTLRRLLEAPTPLLEALEVGVKPEDSPSDGGGTLSEFVLSEGSSLKHLLLHNIATPLDSPRLSNLITLTLCRSAVPQSPQPLLRLLSNSQRLEELRVGELGSSTGDIESSTPVTLPRLKKITLHDTPSAYNAAILASIHTPLCSHVAVHDKSGDGARSESLEALDDVVWCPGGNLATSLIWGDGSSLPLTDWLFVAVNGNRVVVTETLQGSCKLELCRDDIPRIMARLGAFLSRLPLATNIHIRLDGSIDLLPWSERLHTLHHVGSKEACRSMLQQLSQRQINSRTGERLDLPKTFGNRSMVWLGPERGYAPRWGGVAVTGSSTLGWRGWFGSGYTTYVLQVLM